MNEKNLNEKLIAVFKENDIPLQINEISVLTGISSESAEFAALKKALKNLEEQGIIVKKRKRRYILNGFDSDRNFTGILKIQEDRMYVETNSYLKKITVKRKSLNTALNGDSVEVRVIDLKKNKKARGEVVRIIKRAERAIRGVIESDGEFSFLVPYDKSYYVDFLVHSDKLRGAVNGDEVTARFIHWDDPLKSPVAEVVSIVGKAGKGGKHYDVAAEYDSVAEEFLLPREFPPDVTAEVEAIPKKVTAAMIKGRMDLREKLIVTIDPEDARDFDDALSLDILPNGNFNLGVHIADVSHYVPEGSAVDSDASWRGTSVYMVDRVVPMLPEVLSNEICSLQPGRVRLTMSVFMEFTPSGALKKYEIGESVIKSKRRYNYNEVLKIINGAPDKNSELLLSLHKLARTLRSRRFVKGGVNFDSFEVKFVLDENKIPVEGVVKTTTYATSLVEECMLAANKVVAGHIGKLAKENKVSGKLPFIYRIHDIPDIGKLNDVMEFLRILAGGRKLKTFGSKELNEYIAAFDDKPQKYIVNQLMLRTMAKAEYSCNNIGHYGLGFDEYTHFTSPIRRYPDLIVHRMIKEYSNGSVSRKRIRFLEEKLDDLALHSTGRERLAMEAERASVKLAQTLYARKFLGQKFNGTISGVTSFGLFILIDGLFAEGLIHMKDLNDDYYVFDEKKYCLVGRRNKRMFSMGKRLYVQIVDVNVSKRRIDLKLLSDKEDKGK